MGGGGDEIKSRQGSQHFSTLEKQNKENFMKKIVNSKFVKTCDELDLRLSAT